MLANLMNLLRKYMPIVNFNNLQVNAGIFTSVKTISDVCDFWCFCLYFLLGSVDYIGKVHGKTFCSNRLSHFPTEDSEFKNGKDGKNR
jgi:hypothetical protein